MTERFARLDAAEQQLQERLRSSVPDPKRLLDMMRTSCAAELAKLATLESTDVPTFVSGAAELLVQFLPCTEATLSVDDPELGRAVGHAGAGVPGGNAERHELSLDGGAGATLAIVPSTRAADGALDPLVPNVAARLVDVIGRDRARRRRLEAASDPEPNDPWYATLEVLAASASLGAMADAVAALVVGWYGGASAVLVSDPGSVALRIAGAAGLGDHRPAVDGLTPSITGGAAARAFCAGHGEHDPAGVTPLSAEAAVATQLGAIGAWAVPIGPGRPAGVLVAWPMVVPGERRLRTAARLAAIALRRHQDGTDLRRNATHDPLTGLPNRGEIVQQVAAAVDRSRGVASSVAVLVVGLDRFKVVNDSWGHDLGDRLLLAVAGRLRRAMRPGDAVGRLGADEFVVVCEDVGGEFQALQIARTLSDVIARPFSIGGREVFLTSCAGIAVAAPSHVPAGEAAAALLRDADAAMTRAKAAGTNRCELFDESTRHALLERLELHTGLRRAIAGREFGLLYQPEVELGTGRVLGVEALVRWHHRALGIVSPAAFIPAAEETGLIVPLGKLVLEEACRQAARWEAEIGRPFRVWVNLSGRQLSTPDLPETVATVLAATGVSPESVGLEITESAVMEDAEAARAHLHTLRALGVGLAIDDFGTGYSSLAYLKRFTVDRLKVDRSFVSGIVDDPDDASIVAAVIELARVLGLEVVAEGVEEAGQADALARLGCTRAQGYLFARPQSALLITELLRGGAVLRPAER